MPFSCSSKQLLFAVAIVSFSTSWSVGGEKSDAAPMIPGYSRFLESEDRKPEQAGRILLSELNCVSCHKAQQEGLTSFTRQAPVLTEVGDRVRPEFLREYLKDPHLSKPGTTMPDVINTDEEELVEPLVHFLASTGRGPRWVFPARRWLVVARSCLTRLVAWPVINHQKKMPPLPHAVPWSARSEIYDSQPEPVSQDPLHASSGRMPARTWMRVKPIRSPVISSEMWMEFLINLPTTKETGRRFRITMNWNLSKSYSRYRF
ncbi:MAG: hypothetical protein R3C11_02815 [Planctomycetaceae bacterium]